LNPATCGCGRRHLVDLYCGSFGAGDGYTRAGWHVVGVDFVQRQHVPAGVEFIKADVRDVLTDLPFLRSFDAAHASPPCKVHTRLTHLVESQGKKPMHPDLVGVTRDGLDAAGIPYIMENVEGAPMRRDVVLCGSMFPDLRIVVDGQRRWLRRHRLFELGGWGDQGFYLQPEPCCTCQSGCKARMCGHRLAGDRPLGLYGTLGDDIPDGGQTPRTLAEARALIGMPWASWAGITQAIPPVYTRYLGGALLEHLTGVAA
jgi:DNA (cytosine-5)-methyltransferase 1